MIDVLDPSSAWTRGVLSLGLDVALKAAALGLVALGLHGLIGRRRPLVRSVLWNACLVGLLLLPASAAAFPRLQIACLPGPSVAVETSRPIAPASLVSPTDLPPLTHAPESPTAFPAAPASDPDRPAARFDPERAIVMAYLLVALGLLMRLLTSLMAVGVLRRTSVRVEDPPWVEALERWRNRLDLARPIRLARSSRVDVPLVAGWLRPMIVLPEPLVGAAGAKAIDAVILHELAHVRRGDYPWNLLLRLVQVIYWLHPIGWVLGRIIGGAREQACDDLCVYWMGDARDYRASLLDVASGLVRRRPWQALGLAMARSSKLGQRIADIDRSAGASRCLLRWPARVAIAAVVVAAFGMLGSVQLARTVAASAQVPEPKPNLKPTAKQADQEKATEPKDDKEKPEKPSPLDDGLPEVPKVRTIHPKRLDFKVQITQVCSLQSFEPAPVYTRIAGRVSRKNLVRVGDRVKAGQLLAELDAPALASDRAKAEALAAQAMAKQHQAEAAVIGAEAAIEGNMARVSEAKLTIKQTEATLDFQNAQLKRFEQLFKTGAIDQTILEESRNKLVSTKAAIEGSRARITSAQAALSLSKAELQGAKAGLAADQIGARFAGENLEIVRKQASDFKVVAPIDGVVMKRNVEPDTPVRPEEGTPMFVIARTDILSAVTSVPQSDAFLVDRGDPATIYLDAYPTAIEGKVTRVGFELDPRSRSLRVEIDIPNPTGRLLPGQFGSAMITLEIQPNVLVIPSTILENDGVSTFCYRVINGRAVHTPIRRGRSNNQGCEVMEGLKESDEVIVFSPPGNPGIRSGSPVQVIDPKTDKADHPR